jgi:hypothetical protein
MALYTYCHQNPLIMLDPDGRDVIVLNESRGAGGFGHNGILVGNEKNGWTYYSKNGYASNAVWGPNLEGKGGQENSHAYYKTYKEFQTAQPKLDQHKFDRQYRIQTSDAQDKAMNKYGNENIDKPYNIFEVGGAQECADFDRDIISAGNKVQGADSNYIYVPRDKILGVTTGPSDQFKGIKEHNKGQWQYYESGAKK